MGDAGVLKYGNVLAASTAVALGVGAGSATTVFAQVSGGQPAQSPSNPPVPAGQGPGGPAADTIGSNFRRDGTVTVMQRPREGYEALGIRAGTFLVFPKVTLAAEHSDNIYASAVNEESDTIWRVQPDITAQSDWNRHQLTVYARGSLNKFADHADEDTNEYSAGLAGRLDVTRATQVNGNLSLARITEPRSSPNAAILPPGTEPVQFDILTVGVQGRHEFNRLLATGRFESQRYEYESVRTATGTLIDQSFRDRTTSMATGRLDYAISPATAIFGEVTVNRHNGKGISATSPIDRDSKGYNAHVGVNFEITNLMRGDIGVGYLRQEFDGVGQKDLEGFSTNAQLAWLPTQLTTVTLSANRSIQDSAVAGAAGFLSTDVRARVDHELLRNVILTAQVGYGKDEYTGIVREDRRTTAGLGASYLINRTLGLSGTYNYSEQETRRGVGANFKENRFAATLTVQY